MSEFYKFSFQWGKFFTEATATGIFWKLPLLANLLPLHSEYWVHSSTDLPPPHHPLQTKCFILSEMNDKFISK